VPGRAGEGLIIAVPIVISSRRAAGRRAVRRRAGRVSTDRALTAVALGGLLVAASFSITACTSSSRTATAGSGAALNSAATGLSSPASSADTTAATTSARSGPVSSASATTTRASGATSAAASAPPARLVVTYNAWNAAGHDAEASGYVPWRDNPAGTCTLVLVHGSQRVQAMRTATTDVRTTDCGTVVIPGAKLSAGSWTATLSYAGRSGSATSAPFVITVAA
jgi:hypothetical protein